MLRDWQRGKAPLKRKESNRQIETKQNKGIRNCKFPTYYLINHVFHFFAPRISLDLPTALFWNNRSAIIILLSTQFCHPASMLSKKYQCLDTSLILNTLNVLVSIYGYLTSSEANSIQHHTMILLTIEERLIVIGGQSFIPKSCRLRFSLCAL